MAASRGPMAGCSAYRNNEIISSKNLGRLQFARHSPCYDRSHMQYYAGAVKVYCGNKTKLEKTKLKDLSALYDGSLSEKRRVKLLELVSKDLSAITNTFADGVVADKSLVEEVRGQIFTDLLQVLTTQLEQLKAERKQRKKEMKAQKKVVKAQKKLGKKKEDDSSSSSDSSESEYKAVDVAQLRMTQPDKASMTQVTDPSQVAGAIPAVLVENPAYIAGVNGLQRELADSKERMGVEVRREVQVCMGGKCKKSGSEQLLGAFEEGIRRSGMGGEVEAVGCKCMGKCKNSPNVRLQDDFSKELHIGVGIEDVDLVLSHLFGFKTQGNEMMCSDLFPACT